MSYQLDLGAVQSVLSALCGSYDIEVKGARVRLLARWLPGSAVCSLLPDIGDGMLRVAYDLSKPNAVLHVQALIAEWWEGQRQAVLFPDGSVEMLALPCPPVGDGPVGIRVLEASPG